MVMGYYSQEEQQVFAKVFEEHLRRWQAENPPKEPQARKDQAMLADWPYSLRIGQTDALLNAYLGSPEYRANAQRVAQQKSMNWPGHDRLRNYFQANSVPLGTQAQINAVWSHPASFGLGWHKAFLKGFTTDPAIIPSTRPRSSCCQTFRDACRSSCTPQWLRRRLGQILE